MYYPDALLGNIRHTTSLIRTTITLELCISAPCMLQPTYALRTVERKYATMIRRLTTCTHQQQQTQRPDG